MRTRFSSRRLTTLILAWFVALLMAGMVAPAFATGSSTVICSGGMMKMVAEPQDDAAPVASQGLHCPACMAIIAPPPTELLVSAPASAQVISPPATGPPPHAAVQLPWRARAPPSMV
ncbi:MAG TPA: DUF2946 family protein [Ramlibacter sp.]|nr:DUF2946 family protein [Ramlibacter sp.]